jgi:hypothetical protein
MVSELETNECRSNMKNMIFSKSLSQKVCCSWMLGVCLLMTPCLVSAQEAEKRTEVVDLLQLSRELLGKYYETEKLLGQEQADWRLGKELLANRVELMEAQLKELITKTAEEQAKITESDTDRQALDQQNQELSKTFEMQLTAVEALEERVRKLWVRLPEVLQSKVGGQFERLPKRDMPRQDIKASVGERFLSALAILNEATKFHGDVMIVNERRRLKSGTELEVETIYFGLAIGYFAGADLTNPVAGMLIPGEGGWETVEVPEAAVAISDVIAMQKSAKLAGFVPLPIEIR